MITKIMGYRWADRQITAVHDRWEKLAEMREAGVFLALPTTI